MSDNNFLGRRKLIVLGAGAGAAAAAEACSGGAIGPDGPYPWDPWSEGGAGTGSSSGSASGSGGSSNGGHPSSGSSSGNPSSSSGMSSSGGSSGNTSSSSGGSSNGFPSSSGSSTSSSSGSSTSSSSSSSSSSGSSTSSSSGSSGAPCSTTGKIFTMTFSQYPKLMNAGGSYTVNASGYSDPNCRSSQIIVTCQSAGQYTAVSSGCTHQCCAVSFVSVSSGFRCPCHGATFDITGKSTSFIAPKALASLAVCSDANGVYVTIG